ncbi:RIP metalloprotease RseP [candidate division KSB1 bacterium]|nr:RIP metalloprotease RseP [candidate division KSB1 bacterium]
MEAILRLIIGLGILVFIHELGHFILAKLVGIRVERFSLGFPPRMFGKKIGDTDYCVSWVPLGGYVKMSGMIDESMDKDSIKGEPWEFMSKPIYQRFLVILAGPLMNILLAIFIFGTIAYFMGLKEPLGVMVGEIKSQNVSIVTQLQPGDLVLEINNQPIKTLSDFENQVKLPDAAIEFTVERSGQNVTTRFPAAYVDSIEISLPPVIGSFQEDLPAKNSGLQIGDRIVAINGIPVKTWSELTSIIHDSPGQPLRINWVRNGILDSTKIVAAKKDIQGKEIGLIGIGYAVLEKELNFFQAMGHGFNYSWYITRLIGKSIKMIVSGEQKIKEAFAGPIMIAKLAKDSAREGESNFIAFIAFLSLNLGLLNLLPIPVLDGGHIVFLAIEAIIRRPISTKVKLVVQQIGMVLIIALMLFIIYNDIRRLW